MPKGEIVRLDFTSLESRLATFTTEIYEVDPIESKPVITLDKTSDLGIPEWVESEA